jgi:hypothetical protein
MSQDAIDDVLVLNTGDDFDGSTTAITNVSKVVYILKTPYRDGKTQMAFDPLDFIARLAALAPKPRVNLTRYHGVLAPNHRLRGVVTPARRGKEPKTTDNTEIRTPAERHAAMTWAQRLKCDFITLVIIARFNSCKASRLMEKCGHRPTYSMVYGLMTSTPFARMDYAIDR